MRKIGNELEIFSVETEAELKSIISQMMNLMTF